MKIVTLAKKFCKEKVDSDFKSRHVNLPWQHVSRFPHIRAPGYSSPLQEFYFGRMQCHSHCLQQKLWTEMMQASPDNLSNITKWSGTTWTLTFELEQISYNNIVLPTLQWSMYKYPLARTYRNYIARIWFCNLNERYGYDSNLWHRDNILVNICPAIQVVHEEGF